MPAITSKGVILITGIGKPFNVTDDKTGEILPMQKICYVSKAEEEAFMGFDCESKFLTRGQVDIFGKACKGIGYYEVDYKWTTTKKNQAKVSMIGFEFKQGWKDEKLV